MFANLCFAIAFLKVKYHQNKDRVYLVYTRATALAHQDLGF